jgi:nitroreductase/SAM-dependent methyltransferase
MELNEAIKNRRSIRKFKDKKIDIEKIKKIIEAGTLAPSACNRQQWEFILINQQSTKEKIYKECGAQKVILGAPHIILVLYNKEINPEHHANIQSVSAAVQNMLLRAHELAIGTVWIAGFGDTEPLKRICNIPKYLEPLCLILLGEPDEVPSKTPRKSVDEVLCIESFTQKGILIPKTYRTSKWTVQQIIENQRTTSRAKSLDEDREQWSKEEIGRIKNAFLSEIRNNFVEKTNLKIMNILGYDGTIIRQIFSDVYLKNHTIYDIEFSDEAILVLKEKLKDIPIHYLKLEDMQKINDKSIDIISLLFSLEKHPDYKELIKQVTKKLKLDGKIIIAIKNKNSFFGILYWSIENILGIKDMSKFYLSPDPFEPVPLSQVKKILKKEGFSIKTKATFFLPPEIELFNSKIGDYAKRHFKSKFIKKVSKYSLSILSICYRLTRIIKISKFSSSLVILARKKK